jgi:hypothetical protein
MRMMFKMISIVDMNPLSRRRSGLEADDNGKFDAQDHHP